VEGEEVPEVMELLDESGDMGGKIPRERRGELGEGTAGGIMLLLLWRMLGGRNSPEKRKFDAREAPGERGVDGRGGLRLGEEGPRGEGGTRHLGEGRGEGRGELIGDMRVRACNSSS
jgi:hypothetical protein